MSRTTILFSVLGIAAAVLGLAVAWRWLPASKGTGDDSAATIALGKTLYAKHCAACHGVGLQGQRDWKVRCPPDGCRPRRMMHPATPGIIRMACSSVLPRKDRQQLLAGVIRAICRASAM